MIEHWYTALAARIGIRLHTDNPKLLMAKLYAARKSAADPALDNLSIVQPPHEPEQLWIVKRKSDAPERGPSSPESDPQSL